MLLSHPRLEMYWSAVPVCSALLLLLLLLFASRTGVEHPPPRSVFFGYDRHDTAADDLLGRVVNRLSSARIISCCVLRPPASHWLYCLAESFIQWRMSCCSLSAVLVAMPQQGVNCQLEYMRWFPANALLVTDSKNFSVRRWRAVTDWQWGRAKFCCKS